MVSTLVESSTGGVKRSIIVTLAEGSRREMARAGDKLKIPAPMTMNDAADGLSSILKILQESVINALHNAKGRVIAFKAVSSRQVCATRSDVLFIGLQPTPRNCPIRMFR